MGAAESSSTANSSTGCAKTCATCKSLGNRQTDTVKVDMEKLAGEAGKENSAPGKENIAPAPELAPPAVEGGSTNPAATPEPDQRACCEVLRQRPAEEEQKGADWENRMRAEEEAKARERELLRQRKLDEEKEQAQQSRAEEEQNAQAPAKEKMRQAEIHLRRPEQAHAIAALLEEQRRHTLEQEQQEALLRLQEEEEEQMLAARTAQEREDARKSERLTQLLGKAGYGAAGEREVKKGMLGMKSGFSYPLHLAAETKDAQAVELLLWAGADRTVLNSKNQTPLQLAETKNKKGSHAQVIAALAA